MDMVEKVQALLIVMAITLTLQASLSLAAVHAVGDTAGWTTLGNIDYKAWAATKTFKVGDVINFVYNPQHHNVMRGTHAMYRSCNTSAPLETHTSGNDSITITRHGHYFFFCGVPGHCLAGQKVDINVLGPPAIALAPSPIGMTTPPAPAASDSVPGPSPSNTASLNPLTAALGRIMLAGTTLLLFILV